MREKESPGFHVNHSSGRFYKIKGNVYSHEAVSLEKQAVAEEGGGVGGSVISSGC